MKKAVIQFIGLGFVLLLVFQQGTAQTEFSKVYYQEFHQLAIRDVTRTFDDAFLFAGHRDHQDFLIKIDALGDTLWVRLIQGENGYNFYANIIPLKDSSFLLVSNIYNPETENRDVRCVKFDGEGNQLWTSVLEMENTLNPYSVCQTYDGGFVIAGNFFQSNPPYSKIVVLKLDNLGNLQWSKMLTGGNYYNYAYSVKQTSDTGYIITGIVRDSAPSIHSAFLMKLTPEGNIEWSKSCRQPSSNHSSGYEVIILQEGFIVAMQVSDYLFFIKTDLSGNVLWTKDTTLT